MDPNKRPLTDEEFQDTAENVIWDGVEDPNFIHESDSLVTIMYNLLNNYESDPDKDGRNNTDTDQRNGWSDSIMSFNRYIFSGKSGLQKNISISNRDGILRPIDVFLTFISDEVLQLMMTGTNRYVEQLKNNEQYTRSSRIHRWEGTYILEMKKFLGIIIFTGLVNWPRIEYYC